MTSSVASQLPAGVKREHRGWFDMGGVPFHDIAQHVVFLRIALEEWPVLAATPTYKDLLYIGGWPTGHQAADGEGIEL